jgi:hypothetical protein
MVGIDGDDMGISEEILFICRVTTLLQESHCWIKLCILIMIGLLHYH